MESRENQRVVLTKRLLLEALLSVLETKHVRDISVTELCRKAGINRTTFYKHYSTPNDVLEELEKEYTAQIMQLQNDQAAMSAEKRIEASCIFLYENRKMVQLLIRNGMDEKMATTALIRLFQQAAVSAPEIADSHVDETDQKLMITYIVNGCYSLLRSWLTEDLPKSPGEIAKLIYRLATHGWIQDP